jgi:hypothetical protein
VLVYQVFMRGLGVKKRPLDVNGNCEALIEEMRSEFSQAMDRLEERFDNSLNQHEARMTQRFQDISAKVNSIDQRIDAILFRQRPSRS